MDEKKRQEILMRLDALYDNDGVGPESAHEIIVEALEVLGYNDIVEAYNKVNELYDLEILKI